MLVTVLTVTSISVRTVLNISPFTMHKQNYRQKEILDYKPAHKILVLIASASSKGSNKSLHIRLANKGYGSRGGLRPNV